MTKLSPQAQAILDAGREALTPNPATQELVLNNLQTSLADPAASGSPLGQAAGSASTTKFLVVLSLVAGIGGGLWFFGGDSGGPEQAAIEVETPVALQTAPAKPAAANPAAANPAAANPAAEVPSAVGEALEPPLVAETIVSPPPSDEPPPRRQTKAKTKARTRAVPAAINTLLAERKLIGAAQVAIRDHEYRRAQAILQKHSKEFPQGILAPERDAALAIALCLDESEDRGPAVARSFLRAHKNSPLAQRVKSSCGLL